MFEFLTAQLPIERSFLLVPRLAATWCSFWPQQQQRSCWKVLQFLVNSFAVAFGGVGEILYGFVYLSNLMASLEAFCPGVTKLISLLKMTLFFVYNKQYYRIVSELRDMLTKDICPAKRRIIEPLALVANRLSFVLLMAGSTTNTFFNLRPLLSRAYNLWQGLEIVNELPFNVIVPESFRNYPLYPLVYGTLTLSGAMTVFTFSAVDGFFLCVCMYIRALFRMLQHDIRQVFAELQESDEMSSVAQNSRFRHNLSQIVERHNSIIDLCSMFTSKFQVIILMHFLSAAAVLCFSILDLMLNFPSIGVLIYVFYSTAALMQLILYCIGGNYVSESSLEVADTLYDIEWYKCDVKTREMILMMLRRSQKAQSIAVPFFTPSLVAFSSIISTAGSYITLLKTFL